MQTQNENLKKLVCTLQKSNKCSKDEIDALNQKLCAINERYDEQLQMVMCSSYTSYLELYHCFEHRTTH